MNVQGRDGWYYIIKRIEWCVVVTQVDQYEQKTEELRRWPFSEKTKAEAYLETITEWGGWKNLTRYWKDSPDNTRSYTKVYLEYREVNIEDGDFNLP